MTTAVHLSDGTLRALADHELALLERLTASAHLALCGHCRSTLAALREDGRRSADLISLLEHPVDTEEGWRGLAVRLPVRGPARLPSIAGSAWLAWALAALFAVVAAGLAVDRTGAKPSVAASGSGHQDICCWDLDGGGRSDDGVMTLSSAGELLDCVVLYDDVDRSKSFTDGDAIRYVSRPESCAPLAALAPHSPHQGSLAMFVGGE